MADRSVYLARRVADAGVAAWLPDHAVLTEGGRITAVVPARELPPRRREHPPRPMTSVTSRPSPGW